MQLTIICYSHNSTVLEMKKFFQPILELFGLWSTDRISLFGLLFSIAATVMHPSSELWHISGHIVKPTGLWPALGTQFATTLRIRKICRFYMDIINVFTRCDRISLLSGQCLSSKSSFLLLNSGAQFFTVAWESRSTT